MIKVSKPDLPGTKRPSMSVSHALSSAVTSTDKEVPGLLEVLAQVPDPRRKRGRRFSLVFVLAVAAVCTLAGARGFRELGDQAGDLPQELLAALGGAPHPLRRKITAPSEKRLRTLLQALDAAMLDEITGGWLRALAAVGRLEGLLTAIAIDGKWLRGVADGQVKLFAAMLQEEKVIIAQHRIRDDTNEITQVRELLDPVDLTGVVVTADAAHAQHDTAEYIGGERESDYLLTVKGNQPGLQRAIYDKISADCGTAPDHGSMDYSHGRDHQALHLGHRRRRNRVPARRPGAADPPRHLRHRRNRHHQGNRARHHQPGRRPGHPRDPRRPDPRAMGHRIGPLGPFSAYREDASTGYAGNGPQVMATLRNIAVSLLYLAGITEITRTLQSISRDRDRVLGILPL
jgi:predicted transposase YbfD/YdcC